MTLKIDSSKSINLTQTDSEDVSSFEDLRLLIEKTDSIGEFSSPLKGKFIDHLKSLKKTKEGTRLFTLLKESPIPIRVNLNENSINHIKGSHLVIDPLHPTPAIVEKHGQRHLEETILPVIIFHELRHILNYVNNTLKHKIIDFDEVDEYDNLEEFYVINGTNDQCDLCENSLRRELELPQRVSHKSITLQSVIDSQYLSKLAEFNLNGNLSGLLSANKLNPDTVINSNIIEICIQKNNTYMLNRLTDFLLSYDNNYKEQLLEHAIASQNAVFLADLNRRGLSIETEIGILPAKKPIIYFLEETSKDNDQFLNSLLSLDPELNIFNDKQKSLLEIAFEKDLSSCFQVLMSKCPDLINLKNPQNKTIQQVIEESSAENREDFLSLIKSATTASENSGDNPASTESEEIPDIEDFL